MRSYWLVKSEPDAFSWAQQVSRGVEPWTGVRSHQARNNLAAMRRGDRAFFYHSNVGKEIVGVVEVARAAYPDPTGEAATRKSASAANWVCVDMRAKGAFTTPVNPDVAQGRSQIRRPRFGPAVTAVGVAGERGALAADHRNGRLAGERLSVA